MGSSGADLEQAGGRYLTDDCCVAVPQADRNAAACVADRDLLRALLEADQEELEAIPIIGAERAAASEQF